MVFRTIWSQIRLQSPIVCYTETLFMPDTVWGPDLFGHGVHEKLVVFSKGNFNFKRKVTHQSSNQRGAIDQPDCAKLVLQNNHN